MTEKQPKFPRWARNTLLLALTVGEVCALAAIANYYFFPPKAPRNTASFRLEAGGGARRPPLPTLWNADELSRYLKAPDQESQDYAVSTIRDWCYLDPVNAANYLQNQWGRRLIDMGKHKEAAELALLCIKRAPARTANITGLLRLRISALRAAGDVDMALQTAKSLWNVCPLDSADEAIYVLAECLSNAHPEDPKIYTQLIREQVQGAVQSGNARSAILAAIRIDPAPYADVLAADMDDSDVKSITGYATIALLADRPDEAARAIQLLPAAEQERQVDFYSRVYKAKDGLVGRANAFVIAKVAEASDRRIRVRPSPIPWKNVE
jgi:hypothetical protein